jgi:hypothetical protein
MAWIGFMPRPIRDVYSGEVYCIMTRGEARLTITELVFPNILITKRLDRFTLRVRINVNTTSTNNPLNTSSCPCHQREKE